MMVRTRAPVLFSAVRSARSTSRGSSRSSVYGGIQADELCVELRGH